MHAGKLFFNIKKFALLNQQYAATSLSVKLNNHKINVSCICISFNVSSLKNYYLCSYNTVEN